MDKIRLLYFCSDYIVGLTQAHTEQVEQLVKDPRIELFCVSSQNEQEKGLHDRIRKAGINMHIIQDLDVHSNGKALTQEIKKLIQENGITHVNVHNNWQLALVGKLRRNPFNGLKFKLIYTIHGYRHNHPIKAVLAIGMIGSALMFFCDSVISMSDYVSKRFWFLGYKTDRVFYFMNKPEYMKQTNTIDTNSIQMVFPAQFRKGKRQEILVQGLKTYMDRTGDQSIMLHLPGDGPLLNDIKQLAKDLGVENNVKFYGNILLDDVLQLYEKTNIALCSSNVETYGRCISEPFMLGRCVITQKTGVAGDIIRHGENGFFFKSADDLANILVDLHNNPDKIAKIANQAFIDRKILFPEEVLETYYKALLNA